MPRTMYNRPMNYAHPAMQMIAPLIDASLAEDVGSGDVTTMSTVLEDTKTVAELRVKEAGVLSGLHVAKQVFHRVEPSLEIELDAQDGDEVKPGDVAARISGLARGILVGERVALNFLQHMSGIATQTHKMMRLLEGTPTKVLDTRKTIPMMRVLAKYAVRCGGGMNHRQGLYDMILIKENHISAAGGIGKAIQAARKEYPKLPLEVEVTSLEEMHLALPESPDRIMLDNFSPVRVQEAMNQLKTWESETGRKRPEIELSGGMTLDNIREYGETGADFISSGSLTHSVMALDISLIFLEKLG